MWSHLPRPAPTFSEAFLQSLFERYSIDPAQQKAVQRALDYASANRRDACEHGLSARERRDALEALERDIDKVNATLRAVPDTIWEELIHTGELTHSDAPYKAFLTRGQRPPFDILEEDEPCIDISAADPTEIGARITLTQVIQALDLISSLSDITQQITPPVKPGVQVDLPLRRWVADMQRLWERTLRRPFTRDVSPRGAPISEAACFCVDVYREMRPGDPISRVLNEMKIAIKSKRDAQEEMRAIR